MKKMFISIASLFFLCSNAWAVPMMTSTISLYGISVTTTDSLQVSIDLPQKPYYEANANAYVSDLRPYSEHGMNWTVFEEDSFYIEFPICTYGSGYLVIDTFATASYNTAKWAVPDDPGFYGPDSYIYMVSLHNIDAQTVDYNGLQVEGTYDEVHQLELNNRLYFSDNQIGALGIYLYASACGSYLDIPTQPAPVPEPATILLLSTGLVGLVSFGRKKFVTK